MEQELIITVLRFILLYIIIVFGSVFCSYIFKKKSDQTIAISIIAIVILEYIFGLIKHLEIGVIVISALYVCLGIYAIIASIKLNKFKELRKNTITGGFIFLQ